MNKENIIISTLFLILARLEAIEGVIASDRDRDREDDEPADKILDIADEVELDGYYEVAELLRSASDRLLSECE